MGTQITSSIDMAYITQANATNEQSITLRNADSSANTETWDNSMSRVIRIHQTLRLVKRSLYIVDPFISDRNIFIVDILAQQP